MSRLIIAGPRDLTVAPEVIGSFLLELDLKPTVLLNGMASGIDFCARDWRSMYAVDVELHPYPAPWRTWKEKGLPSRKSAGPYRNHLMAKNADALLIIKRGGPVTPGTKSMYTFALQEELDIYIKVVGG